MRSSYWKLRDIPRILIVDIDGCLTNGKFYITHDGNKFKAFHCRDNRAIAQFVAYGFQVHLVTASDWPGIHAYANNLKVEIHITCEKRNKFDIVKEITNGESYIAIGDDVFDLEMLKNAYMAFCPYDADISVINLQNIIRLDTKGGESLMSELIRKLL